MTKILVIEDELAIRENILELLEVQDFESYAAANGREGIELAKKVLPDLILCDISMPEMDGYGVLQSIRANPPTAMIPFIFLTALADKENTRKGMNLGADDYLTKPCRPMELVEAIQTRLKKHADIQQQQRQKIEELRNNITFSLPHELRTPLNGILGFTELLLTDLEDLETEEIREMLLNIQTSSKRLYRLIQNFLLYVDLELVAQSPERLISMQTQSIAHSASVIQEQAQAQAQLANRLKDLKFDLVDVPVQISLNRLKKIVEELLDNALKFAPPKRPITIRSQVEKDMFVLSVQDQGRGMTSEQIMNIGAYMQFERRLYEQQGSGLGLTIVKRLVDLHQGSLTIDSTPEVATVVTVRLPVANGKVEN